MTDTVVCAALPPVGLFGLVTRSRVLRLIGGYSVLAGLGYAIATYAPDSRWQAFGLGLMWPGGGFWAHIDAWHAVAAVSALFLFVVALGLWFGTGNIVAPPLVWLGMAVSAALMHTPLCSSPPPAGVLFILIGAGAAMLAVVTGVRLARAKRRRVRDNTYLETAVFPLRGDDGALPEMSPDHLQRLRFALDRALQPVAEFGGFEHLDPFQTTAIRYQVNVLGYAIALTQARFTPAAAGYLRQAQIQLIDKQAQAPVWRYWGLENLWGNLRLDGNPVGRDNIMFTGFVALQMTLLSRSGSGDFRAPGRFRLTGRLAFDETDFVDRLDSEMRRSDFTLYPCEPNWIYPLCNTIGAAAVRAHDPHRWQAMAGRFRAALDAEFLDLFGRFVPCRSSRTGLALPAIGGVMPLAMPCFFLNAIAPDIGLRQWLLLRRRLFDADGRLRTRAFWPIDTGNYRFSRAAAYAATALAAAELGDGEVYDACLSALDDECPAVEAGGVIHRPRASVWAHGVELMARAGVRDGFCNATVRQVSGPCLEDLPYPDVLIAAAHAVEGGLWAVLYGDGVFTARLTGLEAGGVYAFSGAASGRMMADADGEVLLSLILSGRTELRVGKEAAAWPVA